MKNQHKLRNTTKIRESFKEKKKIQLENQIKEDIPMIKRKLFQLKEEKYSKKKKKIFSIQQEEGKYFKQKNKKKLKLEEIRYSN